MTPTQPTTDLNQPKMHGISSYHVANEGTDEEKLSHSTQRSFYKEQFQGMSLKKQESLECTLTYSLELGSFQDPHTSSS